MTASCNTVGVLGLQGDVREHLAAIARAGGHGVAVRTVEEIDAVGGLIIPGGESTTVGMLLERFGLMEAVRAMPKRGAPVFGTCTGMILLAREIEGSEQPRLGMMDIAVRRNAYGRQVESFEEDVAITGMAGGDFRAVFIRAPKATRWGAGVEVLASVGETPVLLREGRCLAAAFHPELTDDPRAHRLFLDMVETRGTA